VVAEGEDGAATAAELAVQALGGGDREALHAARERQLAVGLDEQVQVVRLQAGVDEPKVGARGADADGAADGAIRAVRAEVANGVDDAKDDVHGVTRDDLGPRHVIRIALAALGRAAALLRDAAIARARAQIE
jgi:hypothetical protein